MDIQQPITHSGYSLQPTTFATDNSRDYKQFRFGRIYWNFWK